MLDETKLAMPCKFTISPSRSVTFDMDRKYMGSHSRNQSRELKPTDFSQLKAFIDSEHPISFYQPPQATNSEQGRIILSNSAYTNRSKMSDVSFSTNHGDMDVDFDAVDSDECDGMRDSGASPEPELDGRGMIPYETKEEILGMTHSGSLLAKKIEEVDKLLSTMEDKEEKKEVTNEIFSTLESVLQRYEAEGFISKRTRSTILDNIFPATGTSGAYDDDVLHCGYLCKRGDWMPQYRRRFVVLLNSGHLRYYMDARCLQKRGEINFLKCLRVDFDGNYFSVHANDTVWRFYSDDPGKLMRWRNAFEMAFKRFLSMQGCSVNLCQCTVWKKEGSWSSWKKRFVTLDDRGKVRVFRNGKSSLVEEDFSTKGLKWESYDTNWGSYPSGMQTTVEGRPLYLAFSHIDKRTIFQRELARAEDLCGYAPSVAPQPQW